MTNKTSVMHALSTHITITYIAASSVALLCMIAAGTAEAAQNVPADEATRLIRTHCADCHSADSPEGDLSLAGVTAFADRDAQVWANVREKVQLGEMPPEDSPQPSAKEKQQLLDWIAAELRRNGVAVEDKFKLPNYGNLVDHEALFRAPDPHPAPATPARLWRIRPEANPLKLAWGC